MRTDALKIMDELLERLKNMTPEKYENFQPEGLAAARALSLDDYIPDSSFVMIIPELNVQFAGFLDVNPLLKNPCLQTPSNVELSSMSYPTAA